MRWSQVRQLFYYKVRQVLLQSATGITKCDDYYKVRQYTRQERFLYLTQPGMGYTLTLQRDTEAVTKDVFFRLMAHRISWEEFSRTV